MLSYALRVKRGQKAIIAIDENTRLNAIEPLVNCRSDLHVHTNRFDLAQHCKRKGFAVVRFSDFDFSGYKDGSLDFFAHRVGKDKALTHYLINEAKRLLKPGGKLIISGMRQEGTKTYAFKASDILGNASTTKTKRSGARVATIEKSSESNDLKLDDKNYTRLSPLQLDEKTQLISKPGIFGWSKIDQGSKFLLENAERIDGKTLLDLGCGYGYLSLYAHRNGASRIVATDNNAAALIACSENLSALGNVFQTVASDAGDAIDETFDVVWCNPPFHEGKKANVGLSARFVRALGRLTKPDGYALVVVNSFIPFEKLATEHFETIAEVANNKNFKVLKFTLPK